MFNTKPLIQSLKTGVKPFLGLDLVQNPGVNLYLCLFNNFFVNIVSILDLNEK